MFEFNTPHQSRRRFLGSLAALTVLSSFEQREAEIILYNGNIVTMGKNPLAQAVAIIDGKFFAVGDNKEIQSLATGRTKKIDLGGKTVLPGFIDAHSHPGSSGLAHLREVVSNSAALMPLQAEFLRRFGGASGEVQRRAS